MTELLSRLFIKNHKNYDDPTVRKSYGTLTSIVGVVGNFLLSLFKLLVGFISGSVSITADAINNLSDAGSSVITFISFKISSKPADKDHPFGHARMEYISSMIVSFLILLVGFEILSNSVKILLGISDPVKTEISLFTIIALGASILVKLWLGLFYNKIGKKTDSGVIRASATDSFMDSISTLAVLVGAIIIKYTDFYLLDAIIGLGVSALIIIAGAKILIETKNAILGEAPVDELIDSIKEIVNTYPEIIGMHDLLVHNYGPKSFIASFHAEVDGSKDIYMLHDVIDNAEREIKEKLNIACTIHLDPISTDDETVNKYREMILETIRELSFGYQIHDFRVVVGNTHTNLIFDIVIPFEEKLPEQKIKEMISENIKIKQNDLYCVITVDRG